MIIKHHVEVNRGVTGGPRMFRHLVSIDVVCNAETSTDAVTLKAWKKGARCGNSHFDSISPLISSGLHKSTAQWSHEQPDTLSFGKPFHNAPKLLHV